MASRFNRAVIVLLLLASSAAGDPVKDLEQFQQRLFEQAAPSVVYISAREGFGSGFFVGPNGLILTNAHVVGKANTVDVVTHDGRKLKGTVVERAAEDVDLALVEVAAGKFPILELRGPEELRVGSWVASVGHGMGGVWTFTTGMVSNIYPADSGRQVFQTQIPLNPGNSGGPVMDRQGRAVGVVTAGIVESNAINFAIRGDVALRYLTRLADRCDCLAMQAPAGVPVCVDGKMVGKGPRVVVPAQPKVYEVFAVVGGVMQKRRVRYPAERVVKLE